MADFLAESEFDDDKQPDSAPEAEAQVEELAIDEAELDAALDAVATDQSGQLDSAFRQAAAKVRQFPRAPGIYLMKDSVGRVIYVGKAKTLRSRAGSYFLKGAQAERRTADWVNEIADADFVLCDSEVDALLMQLKLRALRLIGRFVELAVMIGNLADHFPLAVQRGDIAIKVPK